MTSAPKNHTTATRRIAILAALAGIGLSQPGCLGLASNLMHAVGADLVPADYDELEDCTVAVIAVTDGSQYTNDVAAQELSRRVSEVLLRKVDDIQLVREDLIEQWRDTNGWDSLDFATMGKDLKADKVVGIELANLRLRDGATLYRGRAEVTVKVFDVTTGKQVYVKNLDEFTYPKIAGLYTSDTTETRFRKLYLTVLAAEIGRLFHRYDGTERIALDSKIASQ